MMYPDSIWQWLTYNDNDVYQGVYVSGTPQIRMFFHKSWNHALAAELAKWCRKPYRRWKQIVSATAGTSSSTSSSSSSSLGLTAARFLEVELLPPSGSFHYNFLAKVLCWVDLLEYCERMCVQPQSSTASLSIWNKSEPFGIDLIQKT